MFPFTANLGQRGARRLVPPGPPAAAVCRAGLACWPGPPLPSPSSPVPLAPPLGAAAMAETEERSLDDFFAKRDKKKRKEKSSRGAAAASSAASSASGAAGGTRPADGSGSGAAASNAGSAKTATKEEDDWKEFEQKEEIDYSGLRVQSMQIRYYFFC